MNASIFDPDTSVGQRRVVIRRNNGDIEMVELPWGLEPKATGGRAFTVIRSEGRSFASHRCLVPASEFRTAAEEASINFHSWTATGSISPGSGDRQRANGRKPTLF